MPAQNRVRELTVLAAVAAVAGIALTWWLYGGAPLWPGLVGNFVASFAAFLLALSWDRRSRQEADVKALELERARVEKALEDERERRAAEVRRRLSAVRLEMERLKGSVESVLTSHRGAAHFLPDLPTGAWEAGAEALGRLVADYKLIADLATFYDRVHDLQWRLRFKAEAALGTMSRAEQFEPMVDAIAREIADGLEELLGRVASQISEPEVQPLGVVRGAAEVYIKITPSGREG